METAAAVARRCDLPMKKILYMSVGKGWIFRRGENPVMSEVIDPDKFIHDMELQKAARSR